MAVSVEADALRSAIVAHLAGEPLEVRIEKETDLAIAVLVGPMRSVVNRAFLAQLVRDGDLGAYAAKAAQRAIAGGRPSPA